MVPKFPNLYVSSLRPLEKLSIRRLGCDYVLISGGGNGVLLLTAGRWRACALLSVVSPSTLSSPISREQRFAAHELMSQSTTLRLLCLGVYNTITMSNS